MKLFMITAFITVFIILNIVQDHKVTAKLYSRCGLARELKRIGVPKSDIAKWVCVAEHSSGRETETIKRLSDFSKSYGIFQLNNKLFCRENYKGGLCKAKCHDFLGQSIRSELQCARKYVTFGTCMIPNLPDLAPCFRRKLSPLVEMKTTIPIGNTTTSASTAIEPLVEKKTTIPIGNTTTTASATIEEEPSKKPTISVLKYKAHRDETYILVRSPKQ